MEAVSAPAPGAETLGRGPTWQRRVDVGRSLSTMIETSRPVSRGTSLTRRFTVTAVTAALVAGMGTAVVAAPAAAAPAAPQAAQAHPVIKVGQKDPAVRYLKRQFGLKGKNPRYGKVVATRVARFEARAGMPRDGGKVTPATWRALGVPYSARAAKAREAAKKRAAASAQASRSTGRSAAVLREAARHAGKPYAWGGNGPGAFDCSGYTRYVFAKVGVNLPRTAAQQRGATRWVSRADVRPGDLVFVHSGSYVSHVAIYAGGNMWWESSRPGRPVGKNPAWTSSVSFGRV